MTTPYATSIVGTSGLVSYWELDETGGTSAADSKASNTGTYTGGFTLSQTGISGNAVLFNGTTGYVTVPDATNLHITSAVTVECWCKLTSAPGTSNYSRVVAKPFTANSSPYTAYGIIAENGSKQFEFELAIGGSSVITSGTTVPTAGVWYYVVGTYDGSTRKIYVNGSQEASSSQSGAINSYATALGIGAGLFPTPGNFFSGTVDAVAVYNVALTPGQIQAHYILGRLALGAFAIDGWQTAQVTGGSSPSVTLTTTLTNDIIVLCIFNENGTTVPANIRTVSSVSGGGLTWASRAGYSRTNNNTGRPEIWWAFAASALSAVTITATLSGTTDDSSLVAFGVNGCYTATPWDGNGAVPAYASPTLANSVSPANTISTTNATDLLLAFFGTYAGTSGDGTAIPSGYSLLASQQGTGGNGCVAGVAVKSVTSTQSGVTVT